MPKNYRSPLCVGGPLDGRRVDGKADKTAFDVAVRVPLPSPLEIVPTNDPMETQPIATRVEYRVQTIHFEGGQVQFWAPALQPLNDTIAMLLKAYEDASITKRLNPQTTIIKG